MELQQHEIQQMMNQAADLAVSRALANFDKLKLPDMLSERQALRMLIRKNVPSPMLNTWVNRGMIRNCRTGVAKNSKKEYSRVELEILIKNFKK